MRRILVTGANKGIGLAIAKAILDEHDDTFVFLGSRDSDRGHAAAASLPSTRVDVVVLDVGDDASVARAAEHAKQRLAGELLYGVVNNAGLGTSSGKSLAEIVNVNALGIHRVCTAFLPLLDPKNGRIVNVTSAAGPSYVASCSPELVTFFTDREITWPRLSAFIDERMKENDGKDAYGLSKAIANSYTMLFAREHPNLRVNACTPGFIDTDMTRHYATSKRKTPAEIGAKPPSAGARAPMHLLFGELEGNGRYYGSDAKRSPLDRYREPGSPEFKD